MPDNSARIEEHNVQNNGESKDRQDNISVNSELHEPEVLKVSFMPLKDVVVFPYSLAPLVLEGESAISDMEKITAGNRILGLFNELQEHKLNEMQINIKELGLTIEEFRYGEKNFSRIGVLARIVKMLRFPDGTVRILVRGLKRIKFLRQSPDISSDIVEVIELQEDRDETLETAAMAKNAITQFHEIITSSPFYPEDLRIAILNLNDNSRLADLIADTLNLRFIEKLGILCAVSLRSRFQLLTILLNREIEILHLGSKIQSQVSSAMGQAQREFFLREQLKMIKKELGEDNRSPDIIALSERLAKRKLPPKARETADRELERLQMIPQASAEYNVAHTYLNWIADLPWGEYTQDDIKISDAAKILDEDHYDLKDVKDRILDFLAVIQLKRNSDKKSPILCFIGPPGVGKTSLGQSIARAMKRNFVRVSLGGIRDEAEIRGHRRTYVGALPGRIIQGIKKSGSANPVFMLDEIDKLGADFRGDPASALLEVLDPAQNHSFNDHYLELDFDLSSVLFIATANISDTIPSPLLDRMELIHLPGYTAFEKIQIANKYLIPRQLKENGLSEKRITFPVTTLKRIINDYTYEAGVRNLERSIAAVCRKFAREIVEGKKSAEGKTIISEKDVLKYLGPKKYFPGVVAKKGIPGVVTGMAWTSAGGAIMPVEVRKMPGKGSLKLTGSLGDIMKESAEIAFSFIRSQSQKLAIDTETFSNCDFHIHVPDGATRKDGPSAGITIAASIISLLKNIPADPKIAMTGEINLQGKILPVGGIKEKVIAALAAGVKKIILPEKNKNDLEKIPDEIKKNIKFLFADDIMTAFTLIFGKIIFENTNKKANKKKKA